MVNRGSSSLQLNSINKCRRKERNIYFHVYMKSQHLQSASWRPIRDNGVVRIRVWAGRQGQPIFQFKDRQAEIKISLTPTFHSTEVFSWLDEAHPSHRGVQCYAHSTDSKVNLIQKHPHRCAKPMFNQISGHLVAQSSWRIKVTILAGSWVLA